MYFKILTFVFGKRIFVVQLLRLPAVYVDLPDRCGIKDPAQIIYHHIFYAAVGGSVDRAGRDHIPYSNLMPQKKAASFPDGLRDHKRCCPRCRPVLRLLPGLLQRL